VKYGRWLHAKHDILSPWQADTRPQPMVLSQCFDRRTEFSTQQHPLSDTLKNVPP
jgi:hypothetical protein